VGIWSGFTGVASLTAPFAAGWLLGLGTWRWIFVINVPVAAVLVLVALRHVPESRQAAPAPIDWAGSLLAVVALAAVTYVLMVTSDWRSAAAAPITATIPSDRPIGTCQPAQVTFGARNDAAAGDTDRWLKTACRIGDTM